MKDARLGNQFWKLRSKHGRDRLFASADLMWAAACEYFQWVDDHPWIKKEQAKGGSKPVLDDFGDVILSDGLVDIPTSRPYTLSGLCLYLGCSSQYFGEFKKSLPKDEKDFSLVVDAIYDTMYTQKFEGAAVGAFNANIIARDLGLADKQQTDITTKGDKIDTNGLTPEEKAVLLKLARKNADKT